MCHRISPLLRAELEEALRELKASGHARVPKRSPDTKVPDVYPGKQLPLFVLGSDGLEIVELTWGFPNPASAGQKLVFNTRIETALQQARSGRGLWAAPIALGRCLVPVRSFHEHWTADPTRRGTQVRFTLPNHQVFLLAGVYEGDRFSVVTTQPNASMAPIHNRMPLVLAAGESSAWLGPDYAQLADRSQVMLASAVDEQPRAEERSAS